MRAAELALALALLGCHRSDESREPEFELEPPLAVDHGPVMPYAGTWIGPELRLEFAGCWVLVEPAEPAPGQAPIELRVRIERREGDNAFALQTSIAGVMPVDFLRPADWTMLVEDGALALAMGDEPLERYERVVESAGPGPALIGPSSIDPKALPELVSFELSLACLEFAGTQCAGFEAEGPRALGCREAVWATCITYSIGVDGDGERERTAAPMLLATMLAALRWSRGLEAAAPSNQRELARAVHDRVLTSTVALGHAMVDRAGLPIVSAIAAHLQEAEHTGRLPAGTSAEWTSASRP